MRKKKLDLTNGLNKFFDDFIETNRLIFAKLKDSVNTKQTILTSSLENLENKIANYYNEENLIKDPMAFARIKTLDLNLRKKTENQ